jgi:Methylamine utilisation protein MauE
MVLFLISQSQAWARGLSLDCGCFGTLTHEQVGLPTILRDLALGLPSLAMVWRQPARTLSLDAQLFALPVGSASRAGWQSALPVIVGALALFVAIGTVVTVSGRSQAG